MNAQELTFHPSQLNRGSESVTFKELAKELKDSGNKDLAHEFSRVHRRKTWSDSEREGFEPSEAFFLTLFL